MEILKERFLQLSIQRQIQFGVCSVSICVCVLIFALLTINSFILINLSYIDILKKIDSIDSDTIEAISTFVDSELNVISEISSTNLQWLRNFTINVLSDKEYLKMFKNIPYKTYLKTWKTDEDFKQIDKDCSPNPYDCMIYKYYGDDENNEDLQNYLKVMYLSIPLINVTFASRQPLIVDENLIIRYNILNMKLNTSFFYPYSTIDPAYNKDSMKKTADKILQTLNKTMNKTINMNIKNYDNTSTYNILRDNPLVFTKQRSSIDFPYKDLTYPQIISAISVLYNSIDYMKSNSNISESLIDTYNKTVFSPSLGQYSIFEDSAFVENIFMLEISPIIFEKLSFTISKFFPDIRVLITNADKNVLNYGTCFYFLKKYELNNNITGLTSNRISNSDYFLKNYKIPNSSSFSYASCFPFSNTTPTDSILANLDNTTDATKPAENAVYNQIKRKVQLKLINSYQNKTDPILYKVFQNLISDLSTQMITNSNFLQNTNSYLILIKNTSKVKAAFNDIFNKFIKMMLLILSINFFLWYLILALVLFLLLRVTRSLTEPINILIKEVTSIGQENSGNNKNEDLENISYHDDEDIDHLFKICTNLIKGGFNEESKNLSVHYKYMSNAYNNISYIKSNNLIIQEEFIDKKNLSQTSSIFNYNNEATKSPNTSPNRPIKSWFGSPLIKKTTTQDKDEKSTDFEKNSNGNRAGSIHFDKSLLEQVKVSDNRGTGIQLDSPNTSLKKKDKLEGKKEKTVNIEGSILQDVSNQKVKKNKLISIKDAIKEEDREIIEIVGMLNKEKTFLSEIFNSDDLKVLDI